MSNLKISKLIAKDLKKTFEQGDKILTVLNGVNVEFDQGKSYAIIGVSGSGKSTFMHLLGGLDYPTSGSVFFNDHDIFKFRKKVKEKFLNKKIGFVFQFHYLIKELTVIDNIQITGQISGLDKSACLKRAQNLLQEVGLLDKMHSYPSQLSGGQLQRVAILRAIFNQPSFLLADEPTGDLDADNAQLIVDLLLKCQKEWGMGIILCSHDYSVYSKMSEVFRLHNGVLAL